MKNGVYIGLDVGTTAVKAVAFDKSGQLAALKRAFYPTSSPQPGYVEQDPEQVWLQTRRCLLSLYKLLQVPVLGVGISGAMHSLLAVDAASLPLTPALLWSDGRSAEIARRLNSTSLGEQLYRQTGTPIHPMSPLCKLCWWQQQRPKWLNKVSRWVSLKEYICFKMTGEWLVDYSIASATGLFDIHRLNWCEEALAYARISSDQLSLPVAPETKIQFNEKAIAGIPLIIGASDGCLANLGAGSIDRGDAVMTVGTSSALRCNASAPVIHPAGRLFCYLLSRGRYVYGGGSNAGGNTWQWLNKTLSGSSRINYQKSFDLAAQAPAGCEELSFLPYLTGERAPLWNSSATAVFSGLSIRHERKHMLRACLEGILFNLRLIAVEMNNGNMPALTQIAMSGGMAASPFFMQLAADIMGVRVYLSHTEELSAWGAALLTRESLTGDKSFTSTQSVDTYYPNPHNQALYSGAFEQFKLLLKRYKYL